MSYQINCDQITMSDLSQGAHSLVHFCLKSCNFFVDMSVLNDTAIEERVALLEFQVAALTENTGSLESDLDAVEDEVIIISSQQVLQDQRIVELEIDSDGTRKIQFFHLKLLNLLSILMSIVKTTKCQNLPHFL